MGWSQQVLATFFKNLSATVSDARGGVGVTNQSIEGLSQLDTVILKKLDILGKVVLGSVGLLRLEPLELSSNLVDLGLDGGVRGHLHRGNTVDWKRVTVKTFFKIFLGDGQNSCQELF